MEDEDVIRFLASAELGRLQYFKGVVEGLLIKHELTKK